jgi:hypothetical protein
VAASNSNARRWRKAGIFIFIAIVVSASIWGYFAYQKLLQEIALESARKAVTAAYFPEFAALSLVPIVHPGAHRVGAVYNATTGEWHDEASTCFPGLKVSPATAEALPNVSLTGLASGSVALGLEKILSGSSSAQDVKSVKITFTDVDAEAVPVRALLDAYSEAACQNLKPILDSVRSGLPPKAQTPAFLISRVVYRAKRRLDIEFRSELAAEETLQKNKGLVTGGAKKRDTNSYTVTIQNDVAVPVAMIPAFMPNTTGTVLGAGKKQTDTIWQDFEGNEDMDGPKKLGALLRPLMDVK